MNLTLSLNGSSLRAVDADSKGNDFDFPLLSTMITYDEEGGGCELVCGGRSLYFRPTDVSSPSLANLAAIRTQMATWLSSATLKVDNVELNNVSIDASTLAKSSDITTNIGQPADAAATDDSSSWSLIALIKWIASKFSDARGSGTIAAQTLNAAYTVNLTNGKAIVGIAVTGLAARGATLTIEASDDNGTTWAAVNGIAPGTGILFSILTTDQQFRVNVGGRTNLRLRVSTIGTNGNISVTHNASIAASANALSSPLPAGSNSIGSVSINAAIPAGDNNIGNVGGKTESLLPDVAIAVTTGSAYASGNCVGTKLKFSNILGVKKTGVFHSLCLRDKGNTAKLPMELIIFNADPSATTFTDKTALTINAADVNKIIRRKTILASDYVSVGGIAIVDLSGIGGVLKSTTQDIWVALVATGVGSGNFQSTSDLTLSVGVFQD